MYKKTVTYTDYNGNERTEDFYFNLTTAEIAELQYSTDGGLESYIQRIIDAQDMPSIIKEFKKLVLMAYGEKDNTGKYFNKSEEISQNFSHTEAYSQIFMELATDAEAATAFVNGVIPQAEMDKLTEKQEQNKQTRQDVAPTS